MSESMDRRAPIKSMRTGRPMVLWSTGIVLTLGLVWVVVAVVVPVWQVRRLLVPPGFWETKSNSRSLMIESLGGPQHAVRKLDVYLMMPSNIAPEPDRATFLLLLCGRPAKPVLVREARHEDPTRRMWATLGLARWMDEDDNILPIMLLAIKDPCAKVRRAGVSGLGKSSEKFATIVVPEILGALSDEDSGVRSWAAEALGKLRSPRAVEPLICAMGDGDQAVRAEAARALGVIGDPRGKQPLRATLSDDADERVRSNAAEALKRIRDGPALKVASEVNGVAAPQPGPGAVGIEDGRR